ncbi:hypothetical protein BDC45DRAFT_533677 [Circinella umbellata]|nr:hypothetical protein BDC45DRAFT_533677 [Circinella umbellata]
MKKEIPKSVEERVKEFAEKCNYVHASQSLILDLGDDHWKDVFTSKELDEIRKENGPLVRTLPPALEEKLEELKQLQIHFPSPFTTAAGVALMSWLVETLVITSKYFLKEGCNDVENFMESDKLYYL